MCQNSPDRDILSLHKHVGSDCVDVRVAASLEAILLRIDEPKLSVSFANVTSLSPSFALVLLTILKKRKRRILGSRINLLDMNERIARVVDMSLAALDREAY